MKARQFIYIFILFCCVITFNCKKIGYEEGPKRSLRSTEKKLANTSWELEYYGVNGIDSFAQFPLNPCCLKWSFSIQKEQDRNLGATLRDYPGYYSLIGRFQVDKETNNKPDLPPLSYHKPLNKLNE